MLVEWAVRRFEAAGLALPSVTVFFFDDDACKGAAGLYLDSGAAAIVCNRGGHSNPTRQTLNLGNCSNKRRCWDDRSGDRFSGYNSPTDRRNDREPAGDRLHFTKYTPNITDFALDCLTSALDCIQVKELNNVPGLRGIHHRQLAGRGIYLGPAVEQARLGNTIQEVDRAARDVGSRHEKGGIDPVNGTRRHLEPGSEHATLVLLH